MAGTGHEYEVVNVDRVMESLRVYVAEIGYPEGKAWFVSPRLLRHVTAPTFVVQIKGEEAKQAIMHHGTPRERDILLRRLKEGRDLRMFVPEFLEHLGPDLRHIADWISALPKDDPRMVPKLRKVDVHAAVLHAGRWVSRLARMATLAGDGIVEHVCEAVSGRIWVELKDEDALSAEGRRMDHCVYGYGTRLLNGTRIFSLRGVDGKPFVTLELVPSDSVMAVRQVKGHGNQAPHPRYFPDIVVFLNRMDVKAAVGGDVAGMGIVKDQAGRWRMIHEVAQRIDIGGMAGHSDGGRIHLVSPINPERMVAILVSLPGWRSSSGSDGKHILIGAGDARSHTLTEQRAIARLANELAIREVKDLPYLVSDGGSGWKAWLDTCQEWNIGPARFLSRKDVLYVMNEGMRDILVTVTPGTTGSANLTAKVEVGQRDWTVGEVRNLAAVLDFLRVEWLKDSERSLTRSGMHGGPLGRWFRFKDVAVEFPCAYEGPDGRRYQWLVAPYRIALCDDRGELVVADRDELGRVHSLTGAWSAAQGIMAETCRLLNELGIVAGPDYASIHVSGPRWTETHQKGQYAVVCLGGVWRVVTSWRELLAAARKAGRSRYKDAICRETAIRLLPAPGTHAETDREMARYLAGWAAQADRSDLHMRMNYFREMGSPLSSGDERLKAAAGLMGHLSPSECKALAKAAEMMMRGVMGKSRRPAGIYSITREDKVRNLLLLFRHHLGVKFLGRAVTWSLSGIAPLLTEAGEAVKIDPRWFEILERVSDNPRARSAIREAARNAYWRLRTTPENVRIDNPQDAVDWIRCLETANFWVRSDIVKALGILDGILVTRHEGAEWSAVRTQIAEAVDRYADVPKAA